MIEVARNPKNFMVFQCIHCNPEAKQLREATKEEVGEFSRYIKKVKPFVYSLSDPQNPLDAEQNIDAKLWAPFKVCSYEYLNGWVSVPKDDDPLKVYTACIVCVEKKPGKFHFYNLIQTDKTSHILSFPVDAHADGVANDFILDNFLNRFKQESKGEQKVNEKIRIGSGKDREMIKIRKIIHVTPKKNRPNYTPKRAFPIDWSHRWLVRGHWRKHNGLGKDREDQYCVEGYTWVKDHEKGPDGAPLVSDKVRVVKNED